MVTRAAVLAFGVHMLVPVSAWADIYECAGPDGSVHFTNMRPRGRACRVIIREAARRRPTLGTGARRRAPRLGSEAQDGDRYSRYDAYITEAAALYQLPETFIRAVMRVESDFSPDAVSHAGAVGLMQLMPRTAQSMGVQDPYDPRQNILGGTRYLRVLANRFNGDLVLTIAAYNAGEGAVDRYRGVPPYTETRRYVQRVLHFYYAFRTSGEGSTGSG
jgi:soluble lytic murein transglycosylase-like protein